MRIAVASLDGVAISPHFGRSRCFIIFDVEEGKITGREVRHNTFTAHAQGECQDQHEHDHDHNHSAIVNALRDCDAVLCYGMGWRAAHDLAGSNIKAYILDAASTPEKAASRFARGELKAAGEFCRCHE